MHFSGATIFNPRPGESPRLGEDGGWQIEALCPDGKIELVTGFKSKEEIVEWLASGRCQSWLRARGFAHRDARQAVRSQPLARLILARVDFLKTQGDAAPD